MSVSDFPAEAALLARFDHPAMQGFHRQLAQASGVVVLTLQYQSAYAGALESAADGSRKGVGRQPVLLLVSGGSAGTCWRWITRLPVLSALESQRDSSGACSVVSGDIGVGRRRRLALVPVLRARLDEAAQLFASQLSSATARSSRRRPVVWPAGVFRSAP